MKSLLPGMLLLSSLSAMPGGAWAQTPVPQPSPAPSVKSGPGPGGPNLRDKMMERFMALPPDIQKRISDARNAALQDPAIQQLKQKADDANKAFHAAIRDAILKQDPGLADYVKDLMANGGGGPKQGGQKQSGAGPWRFQNPPPPGFANLSDAERQQLLAARTKAKNDPAVQAAEQLKNAAQTPDQRRDAEKQYHAALRDAELRIDPTLGPILDKLHASSPQQASPGQDTMQPAAQPMQSPAAQ